MRRWRTVGLVMMVSTAVAQPARELSPLARDMLAAHNAVRKQAGVPPFVWSDKLGAVAQSWANTLLKNKQFYHRPRSDYGENLFEIRGGSVTPQDVVHDWASESRDYDYSSNRCRAVCGHYTQIVWRSTVEVGCAVAKGGGREVWVCEYNPPGNFVGQTPY
jgi:pathogenesis-related protein 1